LTVIIKRNKRLGCYSGLYSSRADLYVPANVAELRSVFERAREEGRVVTIRAGAHSFDSQALGNDIVVSMELFRRVDVLEDKRQVYAEAGATWGSIVASLKAKKFVPAGTVTSSQATPGGTLAADCLSRFSPRYGKEDRWVARFALLTISGQEIECSPPPDGSPPATWTDAQRAFMAAAGGFGYLGAIINVTYYVLPVTEPVGSIRTTVHKFDSFKDLATVLIPRTQTAYREHAQERGSQDQPTTLPAVAADSESVPDAIYAGLYLGGRGGAGWLLFTSQFSTEKKLDRLVLYWPQSNPLRIIGEWLMRVPFAAKLLSGWLYDHTPDGYPYIDDLADFLFFMDANARAQRIARRFGITLKTIQQTFIVPADLSADGRARAETDLVAWIERAHKLFADANLTPTLQDVLFLPRDLALCLSPDARGPGFAVSYAFETSNKKTLAAAEDAFRTLSDILHEDFRGRVSLVKNVYVSESTLRKMYAADAVEFWKLKKQLDPDDLLRNKFLDDVLAGLRPRGGVAGADA
jgi:FAD/FMN-containing dehydrogenase